MRCGKCGTFGTTGRKHTWFCPPCWRVEFMLRALDYCEALEANARAVAAGEYADNSRTRLLRDRMRVAYRNLPGES